MIATILPTSANFHAVMYNERKVAKGVARLVEIKNFKGVGVLEDATPAELVAYLQEYSSVNRKIQKAQFHLAVSCKGHEMTEEELLEFTHTYLKEMGYGEEGQPLLVYSHYDTDNTHLHVVTSRDGPDGKKINDHNERRRSQEVINRILGNDAKKKAERDFEKAKQYTFNSFAQFKAIMSTMGYQAYEKNDTVYIKRGGKVLTTMPYADFNDLYKYGKTDTARAMQLRSILMKYRDTCANKEELKKEMKAKFGVDIVFFGKKDKPYGYILVDHSTKGVFHGARVLAVDNLLDFATPEERFSRIESFIDSLLHQNPKITQSEIYKKLRPYHAYIKKGIVYFSGHSSPLKQYMADTIDRNNRINWVESFKPQTQAELDYLCRIGKVSRKDLVDVSAPKQQQWQDAVRDIRTIFNDPDKVYVRPAIRAAGYKVIKDGDNYFAVDFSRNIIIDLNEQGFNVSRLEWQKEPKQQAKKQQPQKQNKPDMGRLNKFRDLGVGRGDNREWEVGYKGRYNEIDDENSLKR